MMPNFDDLPDRRLIVLLRRVRMMGDGNERLLVMKEIAQLMGQARRLLYMPRDGAAVSPAYGVWIKWVFYVAGYSREDIAALRDDFAAAPVERD